MTFRIILALAVALLAVIFVIQNVSAVTVAIFFWKFTLSLALLIFFTFALGFVMGWLLHSLQAYRRVKQEVAEIRSDLKTGR